MTRSGLGDSYFGPSPFDGTPAGPPSAARPRREAHLQRLSLVGHLASVLVAIVAVISVLSTWTTWNTLAVVKDVFSRLFEFTEEQAIGRLEAAENLGLIAGWAYLAIHLAGAVVFIFWLWRARHNAEILSDGLHTRGRGWVIGGWFTPFVAWWFPYQVVRDVWRATDPATRMVDGELRLARGGRLVGWWWAMWVIATVAATVSFRHFRNEPNVESVDEIIRWVRLGAVYDTVSVVAEVVCAVLIVLIIRRISTWQEAPEPAERTET